MNRDFNLELSYRDEVSLNLESMNREYQKMDPNQERERISGRERNVGRECVERETDGRG